MEAGNKLTKKILRIKNVNFGDIECLANGLDPTDKNKKKLLSSYVPEPLSEKTKQNSLIIPYEDVDQINIQEKIIPYII